MSKNYEEYLTIIDSGSPSNRDWKDAMQNFKDKIYFNEGFDNFSENDCIILYEHGKNTFTIYKFENEYTLLFNQNVNKDDNTFLTKDQMLPVIEPILRKLLNEINEMNKKKELSIDSDYYFLVRIIQNTGNKEHNKLQAEGWHHDYMWAPSDYSSIVYLEATNIELKAADFCVYGHNKTSEYEEKYELEKRGTFGTDTWGPGIGSFLTRKEIYDQYKVYLQELKKNNMQDPRSDKKNIAIKIESDKIIKGEIVDYITEDQKDKIVFNFKNYVILPSYFKKLDSHEKWWETDKILVKLEEMVKDKKIEKHNQYFKVNFDDWDKLWKFTLNDLNPGSLLFNLLRGVDKYEEELEKSVDAKETLIFKHFSNPLYLKYKAKNGAASGCPEGRYYDVFKDKQGHEIPVKLLDGILWDNKNTWHRSPFKKIHTGDGDFSRSFLNIRIIKKTLERPTPYISPNLDLSQFKSKYLKYKAKYLALKKKMGEQLGNN